MWLQFTAHPNSSCCLPSKIGIVSRSFRVSLQLQSAPRYDQEMTKKFDLQEAWQRLGHRAESTGLGSFPSARKHRHPRKILWLGNGQGLLAHNEWWWWWNQHYWGDSMYRYLNTLVLVISKVFFTNEMEINCFKFRRNEITFSFESKCPMVDDLPYDLIWYVYRLLVRTINILINLEDSQPSAVCGESGWPNTFR